MDHFTFSPSSSFSSDVDENAVEQLLSQFIDDEVIKITTNPVGKLASAQCGLDPELEARYERLKARESKPRPPAPKLDTQHQQQQQQQHHDSYSTDSNSWCATAEGDSNSSPSERTSSRTFMASPSHRSRSISPPPPKSCFCGSPKKLLKTLSSKKPQPSHSSRFSVKQKPQLKSSTGIDETSSISKGGMVTDEYNGGFQDELDCLSDDELLTNLTTFSLRNQDKQLKKAMQEERKANKDAEKLVSWVKQASARMDVSVVDDVNFLSDDEEEFKKD